jgi:putative glutathione S-transferase
LSDEENVKGVFQAMDQMEAILAKQKYLAGDRLTEADIRAYTTSARFDVAYHGAFKCNFRTLRSYPHLNRWLKSIYWSEEYPEFKETTNFEAVLAPFILSLTLVQKGILPSKLSV